MLLVLKTSAQFETSSNLVEIPGVLLVPPDLALDDSEYFGAPLCTTVTFSLRYVPGPGVLKAFADCVLE